ncbi:hypothetical protein EX30DRAFT_160842 [Ascodesmis nigricans]|uniref:Mid2 domain-containing protein n=1 Tax=Ascodesmis nigricans TaxID=341454 RepID=A0A4S2MMR9_9PEZI|nr:hypothetical protein EX30DRAFT_160842 [Ascodesmis nigricans]
MILRSRTRRWIVIAMMGVFFASTAAAFPSSDDDTFLDDTSHSDTTFANLKLNLNLNLDLNLPIPSLFHRNLPILLRRQYNISCNSTQKICQGFCINTDKTCCEAFNNPGIACRGGYHCFVKPNSTSDDPTWGCCRDGTVCAGDGPTVYGLSTPGMPAATPTTPTTGRVKTVTVTAAVRTITINAATRSSDTTPTPDPNSGEEDAEIAVEPASELASVDPGKKKTALTVPIGIVMAIVAACVIGLGVLISLTWFLFFRDRDGEIKERRKVLKQLRMEGRVCRRV